jgi:hypothetical protein
MLDKLGILHAHPWALGVFAGHLADRLFGERRVHVPGFWRSGRRRPVRRSVVEIGELARAVWVAADLGRLPSSRMS